MLTLARGRAPIAINKLDYSVDSSRKPAPWSDAFRKRIAPFVDEDAHDEKTQV